MHERTMKTAIPAFRTFAVLLALLLGGYLVTAWLANIVSLADAADRVHAGSGAYIFWGLFSLSFALLVAPFALFFRLPKALTPPPSVDDPEYGAFLQSFMSRLRTNLRLSGMEINDEADVANACARLSDSVDAIIRETASTVFVSTAVMQNGRLDGLIVFFTQIRLVWRIAQVYTQRPSPRQMLYLYSNVGVNALVAENLQEIEFMEIAAPIVTAIVPSLKGAFPGFQGVSTLLVNSLAGGCSNAFLTLRVGLMARMHCESLIRPEASALKRNATAQAMSMVGGIARTQGERVVKSSWLAVSRAVGSAVDASVDTVKSTVGQAADAAVGSARSVGDVLSRSWESLRSSLSTKAGGESSEKRR